MKRFWIPTAGVYGPFASAQEELRSFLVEKYPGKSDSLMQEWSAAPRKALITDWQSAPRGTQEEVEEFYRSTDGYLYNLTRWHAANRFPYAETIGDFAARYGLKRLLDYGCGTGTDGLKLLERGFEVTFCDFRNPSMDYLKWRLAKRGKKANLIYVGEDELPQNDLTFAIDVIEHVVDPAGTLKMLASRTKALVPHFPITTQKDKHPMHFHLKKSELRKVIQGQGFRRVWWASYVRYKWGLLLPTEAPDFWLRTP